MEKGILNERAPAHMSVPSRARRTLLLGGTAMLFGLFYLHGCAMPDGLRSTGGMDDVPERVHRSWAMLSPWAPKGVYVPPPEGCVITQVRHVRAPRASPAHHCYSRST
jgi:hypothetical protein